MKSFFSITRLRCHCITGLIFFKAHILIGLSEYITNNDENLTIQKFFSSETLVKYLQANQTKLKKFDPYTIYEGLNHCIQLN